jgi:DNA-binding NtrC family response regulator
MNKKILLVDDDVDVCNLLSALIRDEGYIVDNTSDSQQGALLIEKNTYNACIFDYKMKGLNGIDLLRLAKNKNPQCIVFIISGMLDIEMLRGDEDVDNLVAGIISKPFDIDALLQKIRSIKAPSLGESSKSTA